MRRRPSPQATALSSYPATEQGVSRVPWFTLGDAAVRVRIGGRHDYCPADDVPPHQRGCDNHMRIISVEIEVRDMAIAMLQCDNCGMQISVDLLDEDVKVFVRTR